eukprot:Trichotokara_eunicae@DN4227_c0_g1_i1.p1
MLYYWTGYQVSYPSYWYYYYGTVCVLVPNVCYVPQMPFVPEQRSESNNWNIPDLDLPPLEAGGDDWSESENSFMREELFSQGSKISLENSPSAIMGKLAAV